MLLCGHRHIVTRLVNDVLMSESRSMDVHDIGAKGAEQKASSRLSSEQQRKFEELRERRLQLKNAQDAINSGTKKKRRKRGKKGTDHPATSEKQPPVGVEERPTELQSEHKHVFTASAGKDTATGAGGELSVSPSGRPAGDAVGGTELVPQNPSDVMAIVPAAKTPEIPPKRAKRKKLHWGMEIKERWERKGNM